MKKKYWWFIAGFVALFITAFLIGVEWKGRKYQSQNALEKAQQIKWTAIY